MISIKKESFYDVAVIGSGPVGLMAALAASEAGFSTIVADYTTKNRTKMLDDPRAFTISSGNVFFCKKIGMNNIENDAGIINKVVTFRDKPFATLEYEEEGKKLGLVKRGGSFFEEILNTLQSKNIHIENEFLFSKFEADDYKASIFSNDGKEIKCSLAIFATGSNLEVCTNLGTSRFSKSYSHSCAIFDFEHSAQNPGIAFEQFFPEGPLAILPLFTPYISSAVWTSDSGSAEALTSLDTQTISESFLARMPPILGNQAKIINKPTIFKPQLSFPLSLRGKRFIFAGDAFRCMHPVAGQGLNLGIRDVRELFRLLIRSKRVGEDPGSFTVTKSYIRRRIVDSIKMTSATHGIVKAFSKTSIPMKVITALGIKFIAQSNSLNKVIRDYAADRNGETIFGENYPESEEHLF